MQDNNFTPKKAEDVLDLFDAFRKVKKGYMVSCPFHGADTDPSLHIYDSEATGTHKLMVKCFGCDVSQTEILNFINTNGATVLSQETLEAIANGKKKSKEVKKERGTWKETYSYRDDNGNLVFQINRFENPKSFSFRRPATKEEKEETGKEWVGSKTGVDICLYNSDTIAKMRDKNTSVYLWKVEGESKANLLGSLKLPATCNPFGATKDKFLPEFAEKLKGLNVVLVPDNDLTGYNHIYEVSSMLLPFVNSLKIVILPRLTKLHDDIKDWFNLYGGTKEELLSLLESAEELKNYSPSEIKDKFPYTFLDEEQVELDLSALEELIKDGSSETPQLYSPKLQSYLQKGREILEEHGNFVGVCEMCLNTGFVLGINEDGLPAIIAQLVADPSRGEEAETIMLSNCSHGQEENVEFNF